MSAKRKYLTVSEVNSLLDAACDNAYAERDCCMIYMSFVHGFRVSELRYLRLSDLSLGDRCLYIHRLKNGFSTTHPLLSEEIVLIQRWLAVRETMCRENSDGFFVSRTGGVLSRQRIYQIISALGKKAGISISAHPHMLRHACGYALADRGVDTRLIQDYLGHRNIRHTVRYTASNPHRFSGIWNSEKNFD
ncbi:TPA: tyrosine-type DNA invertase [Serratia marcescens]